MVNLPGATPGARPGVRASNQRGRGPGQQTGDSVKKFLMLAVVLIAAGAAYLYLNSGALMKTFIEKQGSAATGVSVSIGSVEPDLLNGVVTIRGLRIGNPQGFSDGHALSVDVISVGLDANSVGKEVMTITRIYVENPVLTYESLNGVSNFDIIRQNAQSGGGSATPEDDKAQKFIVKLVEFTDGEIIATGLSPTGDALNATMPGFKVKNIGKAEGGVRASEVASQITVAVTTRIIEAVVAGALFDVVGDTVEGITDMIPGLGSKDD